MKRIELEELKALQIGVMDAVFAYCKSEGLRVYLSCGTLLGAVRHKGYIPWDDDIDLMMPRPDYERFLRDFNGSVPDYAVTDNRIDPHYPVLYAKAYDTRTVLEEEVTASPYYVGVNVDIFPLDGVPSDLKESERHLHRIMRLRRKYEIRIAPIPASMKRKEKLRRKFLKFIWKRTWSFGRLNREVHALSTRYGFDESDYFVCGPFPDSLHDHKNKRIFSSDTEVEFNGRKYPAPQGWDEYLTDTYGDYMTPPPADGRASTHVFKAYWK